MFRLEAQGGVEKLPGGTWVSPWRLLIRFDRTPQRRSALLPVSDFGDHISFSFVNSFLFLHEFFT